MDIKIKYKGDTNFVDKVVLTVSPIESLVILKSLRFFSSNPYMNEVDKVTAQKILDDWQEFTNTMQ